MDTLKKYWPWILVAAVGLYLISKLSSRSTALAPQTQLTETPQVDQYSADRLTAFQSALQLIGLQTEVEGQNERARISGGLTNKALDVDLAKTNLFAQAQNLQSQYNYLSRENDRQIQQNAIDSYYSSRNTQSIIGSINQGLSTIFGNRNSSGGVFTPPTFPRFN
jgi:hypothetical protein